MDLEDDWLYDSIREYGKLQMYELEISPKQLLQLDDINICMIGNYPRKNKHELLTVSLPPKLLLDEERQARIKSNDFEIVESNTSFSSQIAAIGRIREDSVVGTFVDDASIYWLKHPLERKVPEEIVNTQLKGTPNFDVCANSHNVLACESLDQPLHVIDCESNKISSSIPILTTLQHDRNSTVCVCAKGNSAYILCQQCGSIAALDLRSAETAVLQCRNEELSNYVFDVGENHRIGVLSLLGHLNVYDDRAPIKHTARTLLDFDKTDSDYIKVKMASKNRISVSGFNNAVLVLEEHGESLRCEFEHKGHEHMGLISERPLVTDHIWLPHIGENVLLSCSNNTSLICWEYRSKNTS